MKRYKRETATDRVAYGIGIVLGKIIKLTVAVIIIVMLVKWLW